MSARIGVLGVLGCAGLVFLSQHKDSLRVRAFGVALCGVCWVFCRARMCAVFVAGFKGCVGFFLMREKQPSTLSTPSTVVDNPLFLLSFACAWFVLGWDFIVLGWVLEVLA